MRTAAPLIGGGATHGDGVVNARSMFVVAVAASPVHELLGKKGLISPREISLTANDIAFSSTAAAYAGL